MPISDTLRRAFVFIVLAGALTLQYAANLFGIAPEFFVNDFQADSEILTIGRLVATRDEGASSHNGALVRLARSDPSQKAADAAYAAYFEGKPAKVEWTYVSQVGIQGMVLSIFDQVLPLSPQTRYVLYRWVFAGALAALLVYLSLWMRREAGDVFECLVGG